MTTPDPLDGVMIHVEQRRTGTLITRYWPATPPLGVCAEQSVSALLIARETWAAGDREAAVNWLAVAQEWRVP